MLRAIALRCAVGFACAAVAVLDAEPVFAAGPNPCELVPAAQAAALTGGSGKGELRAGKGSGPRVQDICRYAGTPGKYLVVASQHDATAFDVLKPHGKPLAGLRADAFYLPGVIYVRKNDRSVSLAWGGDVMHRAAPSPPFVAAAKSAAAKL